MLRMVFLSALFILMPYVAYGVQTYGDCHMYSKEEQLPAILDGDRYCVKDDKNTYCIEWTCPVLECDDPKQSELGKCPYCEGTCSYGGKLYQEGQAFPCVDSVNTCHCLVDNVIGSSKIGVNPDYMCNQDALVSNIEK